MLKDDNKDDIAKTQNYQNIPMLNLRKNMSCKPTSIKKEEFV